MAIRQFFKEFFVLRTALMRTNSSKLQSAVEIMKTPINWLENLTKKKGAEG